MSPIYFAAQYSEVKAPSPGQHIPLVAQDKSIVPVNGMPRFSWVLPFWFSELSILGNFRHVKGEKYREPNYQLSLHNHPYIPNLAWFLSAGSSGCLSSNALNTDRVSWVSVAQRTGLTMQKASDQLAVLCWGGRTLGGQEWRDQFEERAWPINTLDKFSSRG